MRGIVKFYVKGFFAFAAVFAVVLALIDYYDGSIDWLQITIASVFFGVFMSWIIVNAQKKKVREYKKSEVIDKDLKVKQSISFYTELSINEILDLLEKNDITKAWRFKIVSSEIKGITKRSRGSWGERVSVKFAEGKVQVESRPILFTAIFDAGRSFYNVQLVKAIIER